MKEESAMNQKSGKVLFIVLAVSAAVTVSGCRGPAGTASGASSALVGSSAAKMPQSSSVSSLQGDSITSADPFTLAGGSHIKLGKTVTTKQFTLSVPESWSVSPEGDASSSAGQYVLFDKKSDEVYGGGVMKQEWKAQKGEKKIGLPAFLQWMLPNHTSISQTERLPGFSMDAYLLKVEQEVPAASQTYGTHWTYLVFVDSKNSDDSKVTAYQLFFNADFASEADAVKVAQSFQLT